MVNEQLERKQGPDNCVLRDSEERSFARWRFKSFIFVKTAVTNSSSYAALNTAVVPARSFACCSVLGLDSGRVAFLIFYT